MNAQRSLFEIQPLSLHKKDDRRAQAVTLPKAHFNGPVYEPEFDYVRLTGQIGRIYDLMRDGVWRTLNEISDATGDPHASVSAQLRHLRKAKFGSHTIDKRPRGEREHGLWEYRLELPKEID